MSTVLRWGLLSIGLLALPFLTPAQDFTLFDRDVQVHGFASQGFIYTSDNNWLTMNTSDGSGAMTSFAVNASTSVTDKFHIGAQFFDRNMGKIGEWEPTLDWATADYRFAPWFGLRGGKVKSVLGLYNDTQDQEFLHTWAILPQSVYPLDLRDFTIAHEGGDAYGTIGLKKFGDISYTVYGGARPEDMKSGLVYSLDTSTKSGTDPYGVNYIVLSNSRHVNSITGPVFGSDIRWNTPLNGLLAGVSYFKQDPTVKGYYTENNALFEMNTDKDDTLAYYFDYAYKGLRFDGEYRRELYEITVLAQDGKFNAPSYKDMRGGYLALSYRFTKWFEAGTYQSRFVPNWALSHTDELNHIYDQAVTLRFDVDRHIDFKLEGHFIDGAMQSATVNRGFYVAANPDGIKPHTDALVAMTSYRF